MRAELNGSGAVNASFRYKAYGAIAQANGASAPTYLGYAGQLLDPSGLIFMRARWYEPSTARFVTRDLYPLNPGRPMSQNLYGYASANPLLFTDPSGLCDVCDAVRGVARSAAYEVADFFALKPDRVNWNGIGLSLSGGVAGFGGVVTIQFIQTPDGSNSLLIAPGGGGCACAADLGVMWGPVFSNANNPDELRELAAGGDVSVGRVVGGGVDVTVSTNPHGKNVFVAMPGERFQIGAPDLYGAGPFLVDFIGTIVSPTVITFGHGAQ
ncbi:MAG: RHS repeat-associated core domain-containing protein [Chloroflexota bacterium]